MPISSEQPPRWDRNYGHRLREERLRLGLTQQEFSRSCGVTAASQFLYEKGRRSPNGTYLIKATALGVRLTYVFRESAKDESQDFTTLFRLYKHPGYLARDELGNPLDVAELFAVFERLVYKHVNLSQKSEDEKSEGSINKKNAS